jgi:hypothetical protein
MAQSAPARTKINTKVTQPAPGRSSRRPARGPRVSGAARDSVRQSARPVIELDFGILVYPPGTGGEPWRAVFTENGQRKYRGMGPAVVPGQDLREVAGPVRDDAVADLAAGDRELGNGHREAAGR